MENPLHLTYFRPFLYLTRAFNRDKLLYPNVFSRPRILGPCDYIHYQRILFERGYNRSNVEYSLLNFGRSDTHKHLHRVQECRPKNREFVQYSTRDSSCWMRRLRRRNCQPDRSIWHNCFIAFSRSRAENPWNPNHNLFHR